MEGKAMSYRTQRGFLLTVLLLSALDLSVMAQQGATASTSVESRSLLAASADSDRVRDGLTGPVRRVRTEITKLSNKTGKAAEGPRALLETASYDIKGNKLENAYYPLAGETLTGREVYKYDERGNISEMTLHASDGSLISKETYTYEFDFVGNWVKMTTSVAVIEGGKLSFEPTETTYRAITYYLDENLSKMVEPASSTKPAPSTPGEATVNVKTEPGAVVAANASATGATVKQPQQQPATLPVANTLDKTNMVPVSNRSESLPGDAARSNASPVVRVNDAGEPPVKLLPKPLTKPISGGVLNGSATVLPKPDYPEIAKNVRASGMVTVEVVIDETGKVISARAASGHPLLREAAVRAATRARFSPTKLSGQPVKVSGVVNYNFSFN
jgi:TonB family protein